MQAKTVNVDKIYEIFKGNERLDYENIYDMFEDCKETMRRLRIPIAADEKISFKVVKSLKTHSSAMDIVPVLKKSDNHRDVFTIEIEDELTDFTNPNLDLMYVKAKLYHELLHTCKGCRWHYVPFRKYSKKIFEDEGIRANVIAVNDSVFRADLPVAYYGECTNCHNIVYGRLQEEVDYYLDTVTMGEFKRGVPLRCPCCGETYKLKYVRKPEA